MQQWVRRDLPGSALGCGAVLGTDRETARWANSRVMRKGCLVVALLLSNDWSVALAPFSPCCSIPICTQLAVCLPSWSPFTSLSATVAFCRAVQVLWLPGDSWGPGWALYLCRAQEASFFGYCLFYILSPSKINSFFFSPPPPNSSLLVQMTASAVT